MVKGKPTPNPRVFWKKLDSSQKSAAWYQGYLYLYIYINLLWKTSLSKNASRFYFDTTNGVAPRQLFFWMRKKYLFQVLAPTVSFVAFLGGSWHRAVRSYDHSRWARLVCTVSSFQGFIFQWKAQNRLSVDPKKMSLLHWIQKIQQRNDKHSKTSEKMVQFMWRPSGDPSLALLRHVRHVLNLFGNADETWRRPSPWSSFVNRYHPWNKQRGVPIPEKWQRQWTGDFAAPKGASLVVFSRLTFVSFRVRGYGAPWWLMSATKT